MQSMYSEMSRPTFLGGGKLSGQLNIDVGFFMLREERGFRSPRGEPTYNFCTRPTTCWKKSNLLKCQHVDRFKICWFFPSKQNRQMSRQTVDRFGFLGHPSRGSKYHTKKTRVRRGWIPFWYWQLGQYRYWYCLVWATKVALAAICLVFPALVMGYYFLLLKVWHTRSFIDWRICMTIACSNCSDISSVIP
jgi:hypothetical protein